MDLFSPKLRTSVCVQNVQCLADVYSVHIDDLLVVTSFLHVDTRPWLHFQAPDTGATVLPQVAKLVFRVTC